MSADTRNVVQAWGFLEQLIICSPSNPFSSPKKVGIWLKDETAQLLEWSLDVVLGKQNQLSSICLDFSLWLVLTWQRACSRKCRRPHGSSTHLHGISLTSVLEIAPNPGRRSVSTVDTLLLSLVELLLYTLSRCPSHFSCQEAVDRPLVQSSSRPAPAFALSRIPQTYLQAKLYRNPNHGPSIFVEARVMDSSTVLNLPVTCALSPALYPSRSCTALTWHYRLSCPPSD